MKKLMVLTSDDKLGNTGKKTDFWLEEFACAPKVLPMIEPGQNLVDRSVPKL